MATGDTRTASDAGMLVRASQREAAADPEGFWARAAHQLPWFRPWDRVFEWDPPTFRWCIGAIHMVVFAGFGSGALGERLRLSGARALFTTDVTYRKGRDVRLKEIVDDAVNAAGQAVERVIVLGRTGDVPLHGGRDIRWEDFLALGEGRDATHATMEANEPAYILATSGTTARPKLAVHTHGPYQVLIRSMGDWVFGMQPADMWWSTSDIGWVVGHSYIVYAPLLVGCTTIASRGP